MLARTVYSTVRGLRSGETTKTDQQQAQERAVMSVVLEQRLRCGSPDPESKLNASSLGRFCLRRYRHDPALCIVRYDAGEDFAKDIDVERVALGLPARQSEKTISSRFFGMTDEQLRAEREKAQAKRRNAEAAIRLGVDAKAVRVLTRLAWEGLDIGPYDEERAHVGLYHLALFYGYERRPFHET